MTTSLKQTLPYGDSFFTKDKTFYRQLFSMFIIIVLQNIITYSVNVADNIMLGNYSQSALSGAAAINQLQFILQGLILSGLGEGIIVLSAQCWGKKQYHSIEKIIGCGLTWGLGIGVFLMLLTTFAPASVVGIFTDDPVIQSEALSYLDLIKFTYIPFIITNLLISSLRSCKIVGIAFRLSVMTLIINVSINYVLIYGKFGAPEMGIQGAAIGTLTARLVELTVIIIYCIHKKLEVSFRIRAFFTYDKAHMLQYIRVMIPCTVSAILFTASFSAQTAVVGHISSDAIAAISFVSTIFQYCKMVPISIASAISVLIGNLIGSRDLRRLKEYVRTVSGICLLIAILTCILFFLVCHLLLPFYTLSDSAIGYADQLITVLSFVSACTAFQMPHLIGVIRGGGDATYVMLNDIVYASLTLVAGILCGFVFHLPVWLIVLIMNFDQCLKVLTAAIIKVNKYNWIKTLV